VRFGGLPEYGNSDKNQLGFRGALWKFEKSAVNPQFCLGQGLLTFITSLIWDITNCPMLLSMAAVTNMCGFLATLLRDVFFFVFPHPQKPWIEKLETVHLQGEAPHL
jgi:hypothetical protein